MICTNAPLDAAAQSAERLRKTVAGASLKVDGQAIAVTVSIGLAAREAAMADADALVGAADTALYEAKRAGRNRSCLSHGGRMHLGPA